MKKFIKYASFPKKVTIFDFDDTLVKSTAKVILTKASGDVYRLTPYEFAQYDPEVGDEFDFRKFQEISDPKLILENHTEAVRIYASHGVNGVMILTARGAEARPHIEKFLHSKGLSGIQVHCLGDGDPMKKANFIKNLLIKNPSIQKLEFIDDSHKNINAVNDISSHPRLKHVQIVARLYRD